MSTALKYWFHIGSFFETIQPNIRALKLFGSFPFTIVRAAEVTGRTGSNTNTTTTGDCAPLKTLKSEVKFMDVVIFVLWQTFFLQMLYASWPKAFFELPVSHIMAIVTLLLYLLGGINCSISAVMVLVFRKRFIRMMQLVEDADHLFYRCFDVVQHSKIHLVCVSLLAGTVLFQGLMFLNETIAGQLMSNATSVPDNSPWLHAFVYYYTIRTAHVTCVTSFICGLYGFRERLLTLNKQLRFYFLEIPSTDRVTRFDEIMNRMQGFIEIYSNLCDAIRLYCTIFVWQPLIFCASLIIAAIFATLSIWHIFTNTAPLIVGMVMVYSILTLLYGTLFLLLVKLGNDLKREGKQTAVLVHKAINQSSKTPALVERLLLFSHHLQHQRPVVSCGLFNFDWTLALSIISAIATYSVILIQFELGVPRFFINGILQHSTENIANNT
uniref:Gustatory receptor n=1 Tax=Anopheles funestus TaxID=62324 RepID=A0A182R548_ANOFN